MHDPTITLLVRVVFIVLKYSRKKLSIIHKMKNIMSNTWGQNNGLSSYKVGSKLGV